MRPVDKGSTPLDANGSPKVYAKYSHAKRDLIDRLGQYCSYCEQHIPANLAVEHVQPKDLHPQLRNEWSNFLLACVNCNSIKSTKDVALTWALWPDTDNTFFALRYQASGEIIPNVAVLSAEEQQKAANLIELVGLDRITPKEGTVAYITASDLRWENRVAAWHIATANLQAYESAREDIRPILVPLIADAARSGFWSVWMTVFVAYPEVKQALITRYQAASTCFDASANPIPRS